MMIGQKGRFIREIRAVLNDYYSQLKKQNLRHGDKHLPFKVVFLIVRTLQLTRSSELTVSCKT